MEALEVSQLPLTQEPRQPRRANLGCGTDIRDGYINLDSVDLPGVDVVHDLSKFPWPFDDSSLDELVMINVLEHLPDTTRVVDEIHRVLKPNGIATVRVPYWNCWQAFGDPTHRSFFHQTTLNFFDPSTEQFRNRPYYGRARFTIEQVYYWVNWGKWLRIANPFVKGILAVFAGVFCNVIWVLEFKLRALKDAYGPNCAACGERLSVERETFAEATYLECLECTAVFQAARPEHSAIETIYAGEGYFDDVAKGANYLRHERWLRDRARFFLSRASAHLKRPWVGLRVLDVGCATGVLLDEVRRRGADVVGLELSPWAAKVARDRFNIDVRRMDIMKADFDDHSFDLITGIHVIEHVPDPLTVVRRLQHWLKPDGVLVLATPDNSSIGARVFGKRWAYYLPNEHLTIFSPHSARRLYGGAGLHVVGIDHYLWRQSSTFLAIAWLPVSAARGMAQWIRARARGRPAPFRAASIKDGIIVFGRRMRDRDVAAAH